MVIINEYIPTKQELQDEKMERVNYYRSSQCKSFIKYISSIGINRKYLTDKELIDYGDKFRDYWLSKERLRKSIRSSEREKTKPKVKRAIEIKYNNYINRCKGRSREFALSIEEFESFITKPCTYCGSTERLSIDRKDSTIGYTIENSQPCCTPCNSMKSFTPHEVFQEQIEKIVQYQIKKNHTP